MSGKLARGCNMISANFQRCSWQRRYWLLILLGLVGGGLGLAPMLGCTGLFSSQTRRYGPTAPGGYTVRVAPQTAKLAHLQRQPIQVTVETAEGAPADGVQVQFRASEGQVTATTTTTRNGMVTGTFAAATGSDQPRTAYIVVTVENVDVTVFIDIVPAVFGR